MAFELTSPAFENRREIPVRHERPGANLSPFLALRSIRRIVPLELPHHRR